jgi:low affinity Fe/Cu permease
VSGVTRLVGSLTAIAAAIAVVVLWTVGLLYDVASERFITAFTTVTTFAMVFVIQSTQNRESRAMQTKLDALLIANERLNERALLGLEQMPDATIKGVQADVHGAGDADESIVTAPADPSGPAAVDPDDEVDTVDGTPPPADVHSPSVVSSSRTRAVSSAGTPSTSTN